MKELKAIEKRIRELRLELEERETEERLALEEVSLEVGHLVKVHNANFGQETYGRVVKANHNTEYYTIEGRRFGLRIVRKRNNLEKISAYPRR